MKPAVAGVGVFDVALADGEPLPVYAGVASLILFVTLLASARRSCVPPAAIRSTLYASPSSELSLDLLFEQIDRPRSR